MLPAGTWTEFDFPIGSNVSSVNYYHDMWLEKLYQSSTLIGLRLYEPEGGYAEYTNLYNGVYFMTGEFDSDGNKTATAIRTICSPQSRRRTARHSSFTIATQPTAPWSPL